VTLLSRLRPRLRLAVEQRELALGDGRFHQFSGAPKIGRASFRVRRETSDQPEREAEELDVSILDGSPECRRGLSCYPIALRAALERSKEEDPRLAG